MKDYHGKTNIIRNTNQIIEITNTVKKYSLEGIIFFNNSICLKFSSFIFPIQDVCITSYCIPKSLPFESDISQMPSDSLEMLGTYDIGCWRQLLQAQLVDPQFLYSQDKGIFPSNKIH